MSLNSSSIYNQPLGGKLTKEAEAKRNSFYSSSFKQLNSMQSKQVGLVMGACVADAAVRALEDLEEPEILQLISRNDAYETEVLRAASKAQNSDSPAPIYMSYDPIKKPNSFSLLDPCIFGRASGGKRKKQISNEEASSPKPTNSFEEELLVTRSSHSYSYLFMKEYLRSVANSHHPVALSSVEGQWAAIERLFPSDHSTWHGSCPHTVASLALVPANYPWAADENLRAYSSPFADFLTNQTLLPQQPLDTSGPSPQDPFVVPQSMSILGLPLRCLAHNPSPVKNAAMAAIEGSGDVFPNAYLPHIGEVAASLRSAEEGAAMQAQRSPASFSTTAAIEHHRQIMRTAVHIVDRARSFPEGVLMCSRAATVAFPATAAVGAAAASTLSPMALGPLAIIVGAALGAKYAVKSIPLEWLTATPDHEVMGTYAIQLAEWSWNTPSRLRK